MKKIIKHQEETDDIRDRFISSINNLFDSIELLKKLIHK
jgi:hypothetical protein